MGFFAFMVVFDLFFCLKGEEIEVHEAGVEGESSNSDSYVFGFEALVFDEELEAVVLFVIVDGALVVEGVNDDEAASPVRLLVVNMLLMKFMTAVPYP